MFAMLSKLAEIFVKAGQDLLAHRRTIKDTDVAVAILQCVLALQDMCVRGGRILNLATEMINNTGRPDTVEEFEGLMRQQAEAIGTLRSLLDNVKELLATIDGAFYPELVPFLDEKSGLLAKWSRQVALSRFSTTTLFFLPAETLDRVVAIGKSYASTDRLTGDRSGYVLAVTDGIRSAQYREVRDLSNGVAASALPAVEQEIARAQADLVQAKAWCASLLAATQDAVGPEAMARLRRTLVPKPSDR